MRYETIVSNLDLVVDSFHKKMSISVYHGK